MALPEPRDTSIIEEMEESVIMAPRVRIAPEASRVINPMET